METNKKNGINSLFICNKCNTIPLIELVPKESELKILLKCNCNKQKLIKKEIFYKYYSNNNNIAIEQNKKIKNHFINTLLIKYNEYKNYFMNNYQKIKNQINLLLNELIKKTEMLIEQNKKDNEEIDKIIQMLIKNYELNPNNEINKLNIIQNISINPYIYFKEFDFRTFENNITNINKAIKSYLKENYLISKYNYEIIQSFQKEDLIIHLNNNIFASLKKNEYIKIFNIDDISKKIKINKNLSLNNILIDEQKKYLISVEDDHFIKFRKLNEIINNLSKENNNENIDTLSIFEIKHFSLIKNLINLENNLLALIDDNNINIYKYNIENKTSEIINKSDIKINNIKLIKRKNRNSISSYNNGFFNIYEIPSLTLENSIEIKKGYVQTIIYEQISYNEIIFALNNYIYILNIENNPNNIFFSKKINFNIMSLKILKDNTLLIGGRSEIRRLFIKTFEDLPCLISFEDYYDEDEYDYNFINLNRNENDVSSIIELNDGNLLLVLTYDIKIYGIKFKDNINNI